jgi:hypothetical protein
MSAGSTAPRAVAVGQSIATRTHGQLPVARPQDPVRDSRTRQQRQPSHRGPKTCEGAENNVSAQPVHNNVRIIANRGATRRVYPCAARSHARSRERVVRRRVRSHQKKPAGQAPPQSDRSLGTTPRPILRHEAARCGGNSMFSVSAKPVFTANGNRPGSSTGRSTGGGFRLHRPGAGSKPMGSRRPKHT